ncbi:protein IQ-DOMAIN 1 [Zea mays]|uniref:IQ-domain 20 n=2 Tax=Zea mays TaxID=4577 RepID=A0A1D6FIR5_MAIZE|nr:protein IQ-DOMAIN 1 [Zea mays]AQK91671.1 IQ-domain 20 [Zea mays]|eukprot:XP_008657461.2 protein IQ-DOMAIN 1 [Zea mays]
MSSTVKHVVDAQQSGTGEKDAPFVVDGIEMANIEWNGGSDTMDEILVRIQQLEEAVVKRERAMAYTFNHQWRARSATSLGNFSYEVGKGGWGWSWMDRWIVARPWESRSMVHPENPKKAQAKKENTTNPLALKLQGSITLSNNINDRKTLKKKPLPSASLTDQKKPSPSPSSDQKKPVPKEQRAKAAGTPPKPKAKYMKGSQEKKPQPQQRVSPPLSQVRSTFLCTIMSSI